jgi:hypothetical protein
MRQLLAQSRGRFQASRQHSVEDQLKSILIGAGSLPRRFPIKWNPVDRRKRPEILSLEQPPRARARGTCSGAFRRRLR